MKAGGNSECDLPPGQIPDAVELRSRTFPIHEFRLIFGNIESQPHYHKELYWPSRPDCAGNSTASVKN